MFLATALKKKPLPFAARNWLVFSHLMCTFWIGWIWWNTLLMRSCHMVANVDWINRHDGGILEANRKPISRAFGSARAWLLSCWNCLHFHEMCMTSGSASPHERWKSCLFSSCGDDRVQESLNPTEMSNLKAFAAWDHFQAPWRPPVRNPRDVPPKWCPKCLCIDFASETSWNLHEDHVVIRSSLTVIGNEIVVCIWKYRMRSDLCAMRFYGLWSARDFRLQFGSLDRLGINSHH